MLDHEIIKWLNILSFSRKRQRAIVEELLAHAAEDGMDLNDKLDCQRALEILTPCDQCGLILAHKMDCYAGRSNYRASPLIV